MFAWMFDPVCPATGTEPWCSWVRPHCPQNTGGAATAMAPPASATQRHATILFLGSVLMIPSVFLQILAASGAPRERRDARLAAHRVPRDLSLDRTLQGPPGLVRGGHYPLLQKHPPARLPP